MNLRIVCVDVDVYVPDSLFDGTHTVEEVYDNVQGQIAVAIENKDIQLHGNNVHISLNGVDTETDQPVILEEPLFAKE